jgi:hypothetical protein
MSRIRELALAGLAGVALLGLGFLTLGDGSRAPVASTPARAGDVAVTRAPVFLAAPPRSHAEQSTRAVRAPEALVTAEPAPAPAVSIATAELELLFLGRTRGEPIEGAHCRVRTEDGRCFTARSDATGRVEFLAVTGRTVELDTTFEETRCVKLSPGRRTRVQLRVPDPLFARGVVLDPRGSPAPGAEIRMQLRSDPRAGILVTTADEAGRFELADFRSRTHVFAYAAGYTRSPAQLVEEASAGDELVLRLLEAREYAGVVLDERGEPVVDAEVLIGSGLQLHGPDVDGRSSGLFPTVWEGRTDEAGRFRIADVHADDALPVTVRATGFATTCAAAQPDPQQLEIRLPREMPVSGRVVDTDGQPVPDALVMSGEGSALSRATTRTDREGRFVLGGIADAPVLQLRVIHAEYRMRLVDLPLVVLRAGAEIELYAR